MKKKFFLATVVAFIITIIPTSVFAVNETSPIYEIDTLGVFTLSRKLNKNGNSVNVSSKDNIITISLLADFNGAMVFKKSGNFIIEANGYNFSTKKSSDTSKYEEISPIMFNSNNITVTLRNGGTYKAYYSLATILSSSYSQTKIIIEDAKIMKSDYIDNTEFIAAGSATFVLGAEQESSRFLVNSEEYNSKSRPMMVYYTLEDYLDIVPITDDGRLAITHRSYLFTIPVSVDFKETAEIKLENMKLATGQEAVVRITSTSDSENMLKLRNEDNEDFTYKIFNALDSTEEFGVGDTVLTIDADNKDKGGSVNLKFEEASKISYTGDYCGTVNFGVSIEYKVI